MVFRKYTTEERIAAFWNRVEITADDNQCWLWNGAFQKGGYGITCMGTKNVLAHRVAWMYPDYVIPDGMFICHSCDNRACCNPKHLFLGTLKDNVEDMVKKGRQAKGFSLPHCKLTNNQIREIRFRYTNESIFQYQLAIEYGIDQSYVSYIVNDKKRVDL